MHTPFLALLFVVTFLFLSGCKTQSQIRREQQMENLTSQVSEGQRLTADTTIRLQEMEERIGHLHGALEEKGYAEQIQREEALSDLRSRMDAMEATQRDIQQQLQQQKRQMDAQKEYLDRVLKTLEELSRASVDIKKKSTQEVYNEAVRLYRARQYPESRKYFEELLGRDLSEPIRTHTYHNLGMIEYMDQRFAQAVAYFGRLFTEFPESGYNRNGLLFLAKSFEKEGQTNEAIQTLQQLIQRFPDANRIGDARNMLQRLQGG